MLRNWLWLPSTINDHMCCVHKGAETEHDELVVVKSVLSNGLRKGPLIFLFMQNSESLATKITLMY